MKQKQMPKPMKKAHVKPKEEKKPKKHHGLISPPICNRPLRFGELRLPIVQYFNEDENKKKKTKE